MPVFFQWCIRLPFGSSVYDIREILKQIHFIHPTSKCYRVEYGAKIDIEDDGTIYISAENAACCDAAKKMIDTIVFVPEVGMLYYGKVVRILNFGAFVELAPGKDGMVHISKLAERRVEKVEDVVNIGDMVWVKVTDIDEKGRVNLSLRDAQREIAAMEARDAKKHQN